MTNLRLDMIEDYYYRERVNNLTSIEQQKTLDITTQARVKTKKKKNNAPKSL